MFGPGRASDRVQKKLQNYAAFSGQIMQQESNYAADYAIFIKLILSLIFHF